MGLFKKLGDVVRANLNAFLDQIEDKEKLNELKTLESSKHDAFETFSRMEEKIDVAEKESFDKHSDPAELEKELNAMKKKLKDPK